MRKFLFINLVFFNLSLHSEAYIYFEGNEAGMFSHFFKVLSLCQAYENKVIEGGCVSFGADGSYYEAEYGENWWEYYFEPIVLGKSSSKSECRFKAIRCMNIEYGNTRQENYELIKEYIEIKPHIQSKVNNFYSRNFDDHYVIGVHYRGTDKNREAQRVDYKEVVPHIEEAVALLDHSQWKLFIATDEQDFIDYLTNLYPGRVIFNTEAVRSTDLEPLHRMHPHPYLGGEEALIDCLLLSKSNFLIRTSSNLSLASSFFNPTIPVIEMSQRRNYKDNIKCGLYNKAVWRMYFPPIKKDKKPVMVTKKTKRKRTRNKRELFRK